MKSLHLLTAALAVSVLALTSRGQALPAAAASPAANPANLSQYTTADALWLHIQDVKRGPKTRPTSAAEYRNTVASVASQLYDGTTEFVRRFPNDPRKWDARLLQIETGSVIARMSGRPDAAGTVAQLEDLAGQKDAPASDRGEARYQLLGVTISDYMRGDGSVTSGDVVNKLRRFIADFPTYPALDVLKYKVSQTLALGDPMAADMLLKELATSGEGRIADQARKELATKEKLKSPIDLRFTAIDGSPVDLTAMRGKVVMIHFWASWCAPARADLPQLVATYRKLHGQGFEIVGISLDKDKEAMLRYTAESGMNWPEYFDGQGWNNSISSGYGVETIPAMWLVNKRGYVVTTNGRLNLEAQVERLLAEDAK